MGIQFNIDHYFYFLLPYIGGGIIITLFRKFQISISRFRFEIVGRFWELGKWLTLYHLLRPLNMRLDFFWISRYYTGEVLGQYSVALKLVNMFVLLIGTFPLLLLPKASSIRSKEDIKEYWRENNKIIVILLITWGLVLIFAPLFIKVLFGPQYTK